MATPIPKNQVEFSLDELASATGGELRAGRDRVIRGVTTDTREALGGKLFVALPGEHFDGHDFVPAAVGAGAAGVLVSRNVEVPEHVSVVRVSSTLDALGRLALHHRQRWGGLVVAVAGSAGKTTTRAAITAVLEALWPGLVHSAVGNLNNRIGVPMVLFGVGGEHRAVVLEIGTNQRGEVTALAAASAPDVAVLTAIGIEHADGIGDIDAVEAEEGDLFQALGPAGSAVANADDPRCLRQLGRCRAASLIGYGAGAGASYRLLERRALGLVGSRLVIERPGQPSPFELDVPLLGLPGALSVLAACAVGDRLAARPIEAPAFEAAFRTARFEAGRLAPAELSDGTVVLDDTYNSNPVSLRSSIQVARELADQRGARLVLALGEMRELGALSSSEHQAIGRELAGSGAAELIGVAGDAELLVRAAQVGGLSAVFATDAAGGAELARARVQRGDVVLVKGSRSVGMERVVQRLLEERAG